MLIAHRGVHNNIDIPENSLLGFEKAIENNYPIELDVRITKDLKLIVFHDSTLNRMVRVDGNIEEFTLDELNNLKLLDTNEKIPTFHEALTLINGQVLIDIEIKPTKKIKEITKLIFEELKNYNGNMIIKSFEPRIIKNFKKLNPNYTYGLLFKSKYETKFQNVIMNSNLVLLYCKPNFLAVSKKIIRKKRFKKLRKKYPIYIWTIKHEDELKKYKDYCDIYICNNIPFDKKAKQ